MFLQSQVLISLRYSHAPINKKNQHREFMYHRGRNVSRLLFLHFERIVAFPIIIVFVPPKPVRSLLFSSFARLLQQRITIADVYPSIVSRDRRFDDSFTFVDYVLRRPSSAEAAAKFTTDRLPPKASDLTLPRLLLFVSRWKDMKKNDAHQTTVAKTRSRRRRAAAS